MFKNGKIMSESTNNNDVDLNVMETFEKTDICYAVIMLENLGYDYRAILFIHHVVESVLNMYIPVAESRNWNFDNKGV